jgi:hypothetical protein
MAKPKKRVTPVERRIRVYRERNRILRSMGYASYAEYLKSELWQGIRARVLAQSRQCYVCGGYANQAHHRSYREPDLDGRDLRRIFPICHACHETLEFRERDDEKLNPAQATAKMRQLRTLRLKRAGQLPQLPEPPAIDRCVEIPIDPNQLRSLNGEFQSSHIVDLGDLVRLANGTVGQITAIKQANHLPWYLVGDRWVGETKLRAKFVVRDAAEAEPGAALDGGREVGSP